MLKFLHLSRKSSHYAWKKTVFFTYKSEVDAEIASRWIGEVDTTAEHALVLKSHGFDFQFCTLAVVHLEIRSISETSAHGPVNRLKKIATSGVQTEKKWKKDFINAHYEVFVWKHV